MTRILLLTALLACQPAYAGGPIITEEPPIADVRPQGDGGSWVVPVIVGIGILAIIVQSRWGGRGYTQMAFPKRQDYVLRLPDRFGNVL